MVVLQNVMTSQYAWNNALIDNINITRSMTAVRRGFCFPLDVDLSPTPSLNDENNSALFQYMRNVSTDSTFTLSMLHILIKEGRTKYCEQYNKHKIMCTLQVGDVVKARAQVQSVTDKGNVSKLSYRAKGPFVITNNLEKTVSKYNVTIS